MKSLKKIKITKEISIKKALKVISEGTIKIAFVIDKKGKLIGTLTDGDIRRGFLNGLNLNSPIKSIINHHPLTADKNDINDKLLQIALSKKIYQIPSKRKLTRFAQQKPLSTQLFYQVWDKCTTNDIGNSR